MAKFVTLLGFAAADESDALCAAIGAVAGPAVAAVRAAALAAIWQATPSLSEKLRPAGQAASFKSLHIVQRRLEVACQHGAFLPADPAHSRCRAADVQKLLAAASPAIGEALRGPGMCHQWDVLLRWPAETVVAARRNEIAANAAGGGGGREALAASVAAALAREHVLRTSALHAALASVALAIQSAGASQTETGMTILLPRGGESAIDSALRSLDSRITANAEADLRGPLPPISFAAVRIDAAAPADVAAAWKTLALPERVDAALLRRHWRSVAARLHPDSGCKSDAPMVEAGAAFRLLRDLLPSESTEPPRSLPILQREAAARMRVHLSDSALVA